MTWHYLAVRHRFGEDVTIGFVEVYRDDNDAIEAWTEDMEMAPRGETEEDLRFNLRQMTHDLDRWGVIEENDLKVGLKPEFRESAGAAPAGANQFVNRLTWNFRRIASTLVARLRWKGITPAGVGGIGHGSSLTAEDSDAVGDREQIRAILKTEGGAITIEEMSERLGIPSMDILARSLRNQLFWAPGRGKVFPGPIERTWSVARHPGGSSGPTNPGPLEASELHVHERRQPEWGAAD